MRLLKLAFKFWGARPANPTLPVEMDQSKDSIHSVEARHFVAAKRSPELPAPAPAPPAAAPLALRIFSKLAFWTCTWGTLPAAVAPPVLDKIVQIINQLEQLKVKRHEHIKESLGNSSYSNRKCSRDQLESHGWPVDHMASLTHLIDDLPWTSCRNPKSLP